MKISVNFSIFVGAFEVMGRGNQFSYEGKRALFEHMCEIEDETGEEITLDVIALCCEYAEYTNEELLDGFSHLLDEGEDEEKIEAITRKLELETEVILIEGGGWIIGVL